MCTTDFLTVDELARRMRVTRETILRWTRASKIPSMRVGQKTVRFDVKAVADALAFRKQGGAQ